MDRARSNPWLAVAIAAGAILVLAWIGWAIYVTGQHGAGAGLGVVIAWPAMLAALALISLPFIGGYLLVKRLSDPEEPVEDGEPAEEEGRDEPDEEDSDGDEVEPDDEDRSEAEPDDDSGSDAEAKATKS